MNSKILIIILILAGITVYAFNLNNQLFWDDIEWIVSNPYVHSFSWVNFKAWFTQNVLAGIGLESNYYRPFLFSTFTLNYAMHGTHPVGWHLVSNLIHIANGILLFFLLRHLFQKQFIAFWVSLLFLVHPLQTEAVTYISGRGDPLSVLFMLSALLAYLRGRRITPLFLLALALLSRESAIMFPFLFMIVCITASKEPFMRSLKKAFLQAIPYFGIVIAYGILRLTVLNFDHTLNFYAESISNPYTESVLVRMYTFLSILLTYASLLIVPLGQHMDRTHDVLTSLGFWDAWVPLAALIFVVCVLVHLYRKKNPHAQVLFFGFAWFFAAISPMSGITPVNALIYEHWLYFPLIGPFTILVYYLSRLSMRTFVVVMLILLTSWFSYLAIQRNRLWGNPILFFEDILKYEPNNSRTLTNVANLYYDQGDSTKAEEYYLRAVATNTSFPQSYYNLGRLYREQGKFSDAIRQFQQALAVDPQFFYAYQELAITYAQMGAFNESREALLSLMKLRPQDARVYLNLGKIEIALKNKTVAIQWLSQGLPLADNDPEARQEILGLLDELQ